MKKVFYFLLISVLILSCKKNDTKFYSFTGKVQKGPFIIGTTITLNELNESLGQTGKSFSTNIISDIGNFEVNNIELDQNLALLTANGYYYSECYDKLSSAPLTLQAIVDLNEKDNVNINALTHVVKERIQSLVSQGYNFKEANEQAKSEILTFLGVIDNYNLDFENLDISQNSDFNAILLAFSVILERNTTTIFQKPYITAGLSELLANLSFDFGKEGQINEHILIDTLLSNIKTLIPKKRYVRNNIESRYSGLDYSFSIPNFEEYLLIFQKNLRNQLFVNFCYPDSATNEANILVPVDSIFEAKLYTLAAKIPINSKLQIKFSGNNFLVDSLVYGWEFEEIDSNSFVLNSNIDNELMTMNLKLLLSGVAVIEYYENEKELPKYKKFIKWE